MHIAWHKQLAVRCWALLSEANFQISVNCRGPWWPLLPPAPPPPAVLSQLDASVTGTCPGGAGRVESITGQWRLSHKPRLGKGGHGCCGDSWPDGSLAQEPAAGIGHAQQPHPQPTHYWQVLAEVPSPPSPQLVPTRLLLCPMPCCLNESRDPGKPHPFCGGLSWRDKDKGAT